MFWTLQRPWTEKKAIIDKVHRHICGHSNYTDIKILLERNDMWDESVSQYVKETLEKCEVCRTTALPKSSTNVSISSMSKGVNEVVCIDHMYLENLCVFHYMDSKSRFSVGAVVDSTSMIDAVESFESTWMNQFWIPTVLVFDPAFKTELFGKFMEKCGIDYRPLPPRRHGKNVIEPKHRIIREIYLRLNAESSNDPTVTGNVLVQQAIRISNDLFGNDVLSAHEMAKGYTKPVENGKAPMVLPDGIRKAHEDLKPKGN